MGDVVKNVSKGIIYDISFTPIVYLKSIRLDEKRVFLFFLLWGGPPPPPS